MKTNLKNSLLSVANLNTVLRWKNQFVCHLKPNYLFIENVYLPVCPWPALKSSKKWTYFSQDVFWHILCMHDTLFWKNRTNILTNNPAPLLKGSVLELFLKNDSNGYDKFQKKIGIEVMYDSVFNTFLRNVPFAWVYVLNQLN